MKRPQGRHQLRAVFIGFGHRSADASPHDKRARARHRRNFPRELMIYRYARAPRPLFERPSSHLDTEAFQFVTWRLEDALPAEVLDSWIRELEAQQGDQRQELAQRIGKYLDAGHGSCVLKDPRCARAAQEGLFFDHMRKCELVSWVVMPNHVHVLVRPMPRVTLARVIGSLKAGSAKRVNELLGRTGSLWQADYYDTAIRDAEHLANVVSYIEWNPVKAGLVQDPVLYPWSSANPSARARLESVLKSRTEESV